MIIRNGFFGGIKLTGQDASKFVRQFTYGRPKKEAIESAKRGDSLLKQYLDNGVVTMKLK